MMNRDWLRRGGLCVLLLFCAALTGCGWLPPREIQMVSSAQEPTATAHMLAGGEGRLAFIGADGNVYITGADRRSTVAVTHDANAYAEGQGFSYNRIAWSPDGWLAFASVTREGNDAQGRLYVLPPTGEAPRIVAESDLHFFSYIHWSPTTCPGRSNCHHLAYLIREAEGIGLHLVEISPRGVQDRLLVVDRPLFFAWSPDGRHLLWHSGGDGEDNPRAHLTLFDIERNHTQIWPHVPGCYRAPAWSPAGREWLSVSAGVESELLHLQCADTDSGPERGNTHVAASNDEIVFSWSPTGAQVAYATHERGIEGAYGPIQVWDRATGQTRQVTDDGFHVLGFFWAPDGRRLAYLIRLDLPHATWMQWRTVDLETGRDRGFAAFHPSPHMLFVVAGFDQHAQSHSFWSPDGRYLVYSDRDEATVDRVWLVDTWAEKHIQPSLVAEGVIGFWSWGQ